MDTTERLEAMAAELASLAVEAGDEVAVALERVRRAAEYASARQVFATDVEGTHRVDGHRTLGSWVRATTNTSRFVARRACQSAETIAEIEAVRVASAEGRLGAEQLRELARVHHNPRVRHLFADSADLLVGYAESMPYDDFVLLARKWEQLADLDGAHRDHEAVHAERRAGTQVVGNEFVLHAQGGSVQGAQIRAIFQRFCHAEYLTDLELPPEQRRTPGQQAFDALAAIFEAAATAPLGAGAPDPVVNVVVDQATFETALVATADGSTLADAAERDDVTAPGPDPRVRACNTADGALIDPYETVTAALIGTVRQVVVAPNGTVIQLGRRRRTFTGSARIAAWLQGHRCLWPGCGNHHCQIDHSTEWHQQGLTDPANAGPLCPHHNRWKHRGFETRRDPTGTWHTYRPDGTEVGPTQLPRAS